ncbi:glycosyltransferase family 1 protein [Fibrobacter sp. UWB3]|uniref:glycosyltransferase family 4 protein n=1 Tax=Fibrobacter sp. UWB3 TaxID=1964357 RepID=UPI000B51F087|nr:glycosyltransferase family 1 protein [Fibrobacter sp. UWB3]OWV17543.1 glycosyl transferase family 1 [Fibrobacter sp. UWB3]
MIVVNARFLTQPLTGVQRFAFEISKALQYLCNDKDIHFVAPNNILTPQKAKELNVEIIGSHTGHLWEQLDLPQYLRKIGNPLLLNFCNTAPIFYKNKLSTIHDITYIRYPQTFSKSFRYFYKVIIPLVLKTSRHVFTVSNFSKQEISGYYQISNENISVIYNAVDQAFHQQLDENLKKENYLLAVSSVKENKNFGMILKAYKEASKKINNLKLFIVGDLKNNNFSNIDLNIFVKHPGIKFLGRVNDSQLIKLYSNAIAFLFPSLYEGFGIPVLEAQSCACPVIASNVSSLPEVLSNSADLINPQNTNDFIKAIHNIVSNVEHRNALIEAGLKNASRFSWKQSAKKVLSTINEVISNA